MSTKCKKCGAQIIDSSIVFCPKCGLNLRKQSSNSTNAGCIFIVIIIVVLIFIINKNNNENKLTKKDNVAVKKIEPESRLKNIRINMSTNSISECIKQGIYAKVDFNKGKIYVFDKEWNKLDNDEKNTLCLIATYNFKYKQKNKLKKIYIISWYTGKTLMTYPIE